MEKLTVNGIESFLSTRQPLIPSESLTSQHISMFCSFFEKPSILSSLDKLREEAGRIFGQDAQDNNPSLSQIRTALIMAQDALTIIGHRFGLEKEALELLQLPSYIQDRTQGLIDLVNKINSLHAYEDNGETANIEESFVLPTNDSLDDLLSSMYLNEQSNNQKYTDYLKSTNSESSSTYPLTQKTTNLLEPILIKSSSNYENQNLLNNEEIHLRIQKRKEIIRFLDEKRHEPPILTDSVLGWFRPAVSQRLIEANIHTLGSLLHIINHKGWHWYKNINQLGELTAKNIHQFIQKTSVDLGETIHPFAQKKQKESSILVVDPNENIIDIPSSDQQLLVRKTGVTPLELFALPSNLTGEFGSNRDSHHLNKLSANNDYEAIIEWLNLHQGATKEAYKKEAERLLLWVIINKRKALSSLTTADFVEFKDFLLNPTPAHLWVTNKRYPRAHPNWKPFTGKLSNNTVSYSFTVIYALFEFLVSQQYLQSNPVRAVPRNIRSKRTNRKMDRLIPVRLWKVIDQAIMDEKVADTVNYRTAFLIKFLYLTGLRLEEIANVKLGDFYVIENDNGDLSWRLKVIGKGSKERNIIIVEVAQRLVFEYLLIRELPADPRLNNPETYLISPIGKTTGLSNSRIYDSIKEYIFRISLPLEKTQPLDFQLLNRISTHWIRHTFASRLAKNAELSIVMKMLGHSSLQTTSIYVQTEDKESEKAMESTFS